jgi:hypothetical protein
MTRLTRRWAFEFGYQQLEMVEDGRALPVEVEREADLPLPESIEWHSGLYFTNIGKAWQPIYARGGSPVLMERKFSAGSLVMATDSYLVSNEALRKNREPELLAWLVGNAQQVMFDEAHLGIVEQTGVATLMKRYRLFGVVLAALVVAGLFLWKNAVPFLPLRAEEQMEDFLQGREASAGLINLLRRNIPADNLLKTCVAEWGKSLAPGHGVNTARLEEVRATVQAEEALPARHRDAVRAYHAICQCLSRKHAVKQERTET